MIPSHLAGNPFFPGQEGDHEMSEWEVYLCLWKGGQKLCWEANPFAKKQMGGRKQYLLNIY